MNTTPENSDDAWVSKTQKKKQMDALQDLGAELTRLSADTLKKIGLPEDLLQAVLAHKKITSNSALKRQVQYIGRLMRETDPAPIEAYLAKIKGDNTAHNTELVAKYPAIDVGSLRTLIRNARKEKEQAKPPKAYRALFQQLRAEIGENDAI